MAKQIYIWSENTLFTSLISQVFDLHIWPIILEVIFIVNNKNRSLEKYFCSIKCLILGQRKVIGKTDIGAPNFQLLNCYLDH